MNKVLQFILYLYLSTCVVADVRKNGRLPDYASLCPFNTFCTTSPTKNITQTNQESCCQECSCDPDCHMVGDCCHDVRHNFEDIMPRYQCVYPKILLDVDRRFKYTTGYQGKDFYRIIDNCPDTNSSNQFPKCDRPKKIEDYVIVSDALSERVFKNKHCALCHGVEDIIEWDLETYCKEIHTQTFKSFEEMHEYILENCSMKSVAPEASIGDTVRCYIDVKRTCNLTWQWDVYDQAVEDACLKERPLQNTIFKGFKNSFTKDYTIFANVYCFMCNIKNSQIHELYEKTCDVPQHVNLDRDVSPVSFSAVLKHVHDDKFDKSARCESTEILDIWTGACRPFYCPIGTIPLRGRCEYITQYLRGVKHNVLFYVHLRQGNLTLLRENAYIMENIISKKIGHPFECGLCWPEFLYSRNKSTTVYKHSFYTTRKCSLVSRIEQMKIFITRGRTVKKFNFQNKRFELVLDIALENDVGVTLISVDEKLGDSCKNALQVHVNAFLLQDCPRFQMPIEDLYDIGFKHAVIETSQDLTIVIDKANNLASVCVEKYFELRNSLSQSLRTSSHIVAASVLLGLILLQRTA